MKNALSLVLLVRKLIQVAGVSEGLDANRDVSTPRFRLVRSHWFNNTRCTPLGRSAERADDRKYSDGLTNARHRRFVLEYRSESDARRMASRPRLISFR